MYHGGPKVQAHTHAHAEPPANAGPAIDLTVEVNGEWQARQVEAGEKDPNSGGKTVYMSPGLRYSTSTWTGYVSVGIPVVKDLNGIQSEPDVRVVTGLSLGF